MSTMEQHFNNIKISVNRMIESNLPLEKELRKLHEEQEDDELRIERESFRTLLNLDMLHETMDQREEERFAMNYYSLNHKMDRVEAMYREQQEQQQMDGNRIDRKNVRDSLKNLCYTISVFHFVNILANLLEGLCLTQDQINSHGLRERAEDLKLEAEIIFKEEKKSYLVLKEKFDNTAPLSDLSRNWSKALESNQQKTAFLVSKLKDMRVGCNEIVENLCAKQMQYPCFRSQAQFIIPPVVELGESVMDKQLELIWRVRISTLKIDSLITRCSVLCERLKLLQKGVDSPKAVIERSSQFIFTKFLREAAHTIRVLEDLVNTSKYLENLVKQDEMSSDKLKAKAEDLMLRMESVVKLEDQLLSQIRDEYQKIATSGAESHKWSKVLGLVQQNSLIIVYELEIIRRVYTKIAGNLYDIDKQRTESFAGG